jgi:hydrogenase expression/formation protein HypC
VLTVCLGVPGEVVRIDRDAALPTGTVDFGGVRREVCLAYVPDVSIGEHVLVHVGFALATIDAAEAARTWALLEEMAQLEEVLAEETALLHGELGSGAGEAAP